MVLDLMMPHVGGHKVLETAKVSLATAGLPTIVLTAQNDRQMEIRVLCGARTTTSASPVDPAVFMNRVQAPLRRTRS